VLDDAHPFSGCDTQDIASDDIPGTHCVIDYEHGELVTSRSIDPDEFTVLQQPLARFGRMKSDHRTPFRVA
jgi:hypothetical protein